MKICSMILSNERINKAYHRGEIQLKQKRGRSFRNAAAMNTMRWEVYNKAKAEFDKIYYTFGYFTKYIRINNCIEKSHNADAYCIAHNIQAKRLDGYLRIRLLPRHYRILHVFNPKKGGIRRSSVASHWIGSSKLQRFDSVVWSGIKCFIFGSSHGRLVLRDLDGKLVTEKQTTHTKNVTFGNRNKGFIMQEYLQNLVIN